MAVELQLQTAISERPEGHNSGASCPWRNAPDAGVRHFCMTDGMHSLMLILDWQCLRRMRHYVDHSTLSIGIVAMFKILPKYFEWCCICPLWICAHIDPANRHVGCAAVRESVDSRGLGMYACRKPWEEVDPPPLI